MSRSVRPADRPIAALAAAVAREGRPGEWALGPRHTSRSARAGAAPLAITAEAGAADRLQKIRSGFPRAAVRGVRLPMAALLFCLGLGVGAAGADCSAALAGDGHEHGESGALGTVFALLDETGTVVTSKEVFDTPSLLYFGYTFCPDICPTDVARNAAAVDLLAERGMSVKPVLITIDPGRDTPATLAQFTDMLHPRMIGLTGSVAQIDAVAAAYGVVHSAAEPGEEYYLLDHSTFTYLVEPGGEVVERYSRVLSADELAEAVACAFAP